MSYQYRKILVTGADGFIGSHLTEILLERGFRVRALSYYNSLNHWGWLEDVISSENLEIVTGDVRDSHFCMHILKDVDLVFHLAALIAIPYSYIAPDSYVDTNVKGTLNICQAALKNGGVRVVHVSSSEVYGTAQYVPIDERHPKQPQSPYSASKIAADAMAMSFNNSFELPVTTARPFNTFGPRQSARAIIPTIISQIASGMKEIKLGDLSPTRDLNFVGDICGGLIAIAESEATIGKEINISSCREISMGEVFDLISKIMKAEVRAVNDKERFRPENSEVFRLLGDSSLLKELTGFSQSYSFEDGLRITCDWISKPKNLEKYKVDIYNK